MKLVARHAWACAVLQVVLCLLMVSANSNQPVAGKTETIPPKVIGGDRDAHGCLAPAGYAWCAKEQACVRPWELTKTQGFDLAQDGFAKYCLPAMAMSSQTALTLSPSGAQVLKGTLAPGKDMDWRLALKGGKEARFTITRGMQGLSVDVYDPQGIAANEGVSDGDWFPVADGEYKVTITNTTALSNKTPGKEVAYEVLFESR